MTLRRTKISWADYSGVDLNFIIGCTPVSEGCKNCYARSWAKRVGRQYWEDVVRIYWEKLNRLWKAKWEPGDTPYRRGPGSKPIMFPCDLSDLFHLDVPGEMIQVALDIFATRDDADWVLLTKRPGRMLEETNYWLELNELEQLPPNIWCMVTAENQCRADERIPILLWVKAHVLGVSLEPMLEPINLDGPCLYHHSLDFKDTAETILEYGQQFWVILGAESGPNRRPFEVAWAESVYKQCRAAGIPFFGKQDSGLRPGAVLHLPCPECDGSGYLSNGLGSGEGCGCNGQRWEIKEFPR